MQDTHDLSRRKVLAGLGAIGTASVGAGMGTSAYFSDTETFGNNTLVAGSLDMTVDWEEHYVDWSEDEAEFAEMAEDPSDADYLLPALQPVTRLRNGEYPNGLVGSLTNGFQSDAMPIALNFVGEGTLEENKDAFWDATSIEAYPDVDDDGIQDAFDASYDIGDITVTIPDACAAGAQLDEDLDPRPQGALRTENDDTLTAEETPAPLVSLEDVKPGDFGEVTFSFHLCDNPGYVWMNGELLENDEVSVTEPEADDPHEDQTADDPGDDFDGELAEHILARIWYDDCDNQVDSESGELDLMLAVDVSGSITGDAQQQMRDGVNAFLDELPVDGSVRVGTLTFGDSAVGSLQSLDNPSNVSVSLPTFGGNTPLPAALDIADQAVRNEPTARSGAQKAVVVFTDGGPNYQNTSYSAGGYDAPRNDTADWSADAGDTVYDNADAASGTVSEAEMDETALVADSVRGMTTRIATVFVGEDDSTDAMTPGAISTYVNLPSYLAAEIASPGFSFTVDFPDLESLATQLVQSIIVGEEVFFLGTLRQALVLLESGNGIPLDPNPDTPFDELADDPADPDRECFDAETTHCVGLEWWLPLDHANQIQTDNVRFDVGFYTEQCRHNEGAGITAD